MGLVEIPTEMVLPIEKSTAKGLLMQGHDFQPVSFLRKLRRMLNHQLRMGRQLNFVRISPSLSDQRKGCRGSRISSSGRFFLGHSTQKFTFKLSFTPWDCGRCTCDVSIQGAMAFPWWYRASATRRRHAPHPAAPGESSCPVAWDRHG